MAPASALSLAFFSSLASDLAAARSLTRDSRSRAKEDSASARVCSRAATDPSSVFCRRFLCVATARSSASRSLTPSAIRLCAAASSSLRSFSLSLSFLTRPAETFSFFLNFSSSLESPPSSVPWSGDFSAAAAIALACSSSPSRSVIRRWDAPSASFMASLISSSRSTAAWVRSMMGERVSRQSGRAGRRTRARHSALRTHSSPGFPS